MKELLSKLSSYNIFNYLLPGVVFVGIAPLVSGVSLVHENLLIGAFLYYFIGLVISRVGSLVIEPALKKFRVVRFVDYRDFVAASKQDEKLEVLSEANNTYRTLSSMCLLLIALRIYGWLGTRVTFIAEWGPEILLLLLLVMFIVSYRKQTNYVVQRVDANK